jgi:hypothetical protein
MEKHLAVVALELELVVAPQQKAASSLWVKREQKIS